ncbi:MAG: acyl-CoA dehydrogenase family protein [Ilumatobacteraceae bacterium]
MPADPVIAPLGDLTDVLAAIGSRAAEHDRQATFPFEAFSALWSTGALNLTIPVEHGGHGLGLVPATALVLAVAERDPAVALPLAQHLMTHRGLAVAPEAWPADVLRRVRRSSIDGVALINALRVEPELGTPARGGLPATTAVRSTNGAGWLLNGRKIYSTGIPMLRWMLVWARSDDTDPLVGSFLVEAGTPGLRVVETWDSLGMRATRSDDVVFEDAPIPLEHAVDVVPASELRLTAAQTAFATWNGVLIGSIYHGVARAARDWLGRYLNERVPSNLGAPLASLPRFQESFGRIAAQVELGDGLLRDAAAAIDAGGDPAELAGRANLVKLTVTNAAIDIALDAVRLVGNPGLLRTNPLERHLRNVLHGRVHTPQDDTILLALGRRGLDDAAALSRSSNTPVIS